MYTAEAKGSKATLGNRAENIGTALGETDTKTASKRYRADPDRPAQARHHRHPEQQ
jgi:hypothetical protein